MNWIEAMYDNTFWTATSCMGREWKITKRLYQNQIYFSIGESREMLTNDQIKLFEFFDDAKEWCEALEEAYVDAKSQGLDYKDY